METYGCKAMGLLLVLGVAGCSKEGPSDVKSISSPVFFLTVEDGTAYENRSGATLTASFDEDDGEDQLQSIAFEFEVEVVGGTRVIGLAVSTGDLAGLSHLELSEGGDSQASLTINGKEVIFRSGTVVTTMKQGKVEGSFNVENEMVATELSATFEGKLKVSCMYPYSSAPDDAGGLEPLGGGTVSISAPDGDRDSCLDLKNQLGL